MTDCPTHKQPMTPKRFAEIKARCEAATKGPWEAFKSYQNAISIYFGDPPREICSYVTDAVSNKFPVRVQRNMLFIAHARQDLPDCLDEIERLQTACRMAYQGLCTDDEEAQQKAIKLIDELET